MEIQAQSTVASTVSTSSASNGANGNAAGGTANALSGSKTGFSTTLNGMLVGEVNATQGTSQGSLVGLNAIAQLMAALKEDTNASAQQSLQDSLQSLDDLIKLLESDTDDALALLDNPDVQAWLAQIQAILLQAANASATPVQSNDAGNSAAIEMVSSTPVQSNDEASSAAIETVERLSGQEGSAKLNQQLFVPLEALATGEDALQQLSAADLKPVTKEEAKKLLENFKQLLQANQDQNSNLLTGSAVQKVVADIQQVLAPLLSVQSDTDAITDSEVAAQVVSNQTSDQAATASAVVNGLKKDTAYQVNVSSVNPKLEFLAAKTLAPKLAVEEPVIEAPLFEPLQEMVVDSSTDNNVMPMHEFLKQVQSSEQIAKAPVLLMHAHSFVEDMAEFVIKSFTLDARAEGLTEAKLSLYPQHLGQVDVKLTLHNGQLIAQFMADSVTGKEMLESQLSQLRATLQNQGIQVDKLEVTQSQSFQSGMFQDQRQHQSQQSNKQQKGNGTNKVLSLDEEMAQEAAKTTTPASSRLGQTSFDTTA